MIQTLLDTVVILITLPPFVLATVMAWRGEVLFD